jgi:hypothetical protein
MIDGLFERAQHIPVWILSLGNAVVGVEELEAKMAKHGRRVKSIALRYQHMPAVATEEKKATNQEFIVVGVDPGLCAREGRSRMNENARPLSEAGSDCASRSTTSSRTRSTATSCPRTSRRSSGRTSSAPAATRS